MRLRFFFEIISIIFIYIYSVNAVGCILFCNEETTATEASVTSATPTSQKPASTVDPTSAPPPTISSVSQTSTSVKPTSTSKSSSLIQPTSSSSILPSTISSSSIILTMSSMTSSLIPSPSASTEPNKSDDSGSNKTGVIIGSVCAFIAIIGAGFAYAFFSKTRRQNRRNRNYQQQHDMYNETPYSDPFAARSSPGITPAAMHTMETPSYTNQWEMEQQQQHYNQAMFSPVPSPYMPPVNYPVNEPYYYDPNAAYSQPYENYAAQPPMASHITNSTVYSSPHSYPDDRPTAK